MNRPKFVLPGLEEYKTWSELLTYALARKQHSINRRGHQEALYWHKIGEWARNNTDDSDERLAELFHAYGLSIQSSNHSFEDKALWHAYRVHLRKMLIARGCKMPRLSLAWLRAEREVK
jgi:hypothetical protein